MAGIIAGAPYVPYLMLNRQTVAGAWEKRGQRGFRGVANHDEDSLTLAAEAAARCLGGEAASTVEALYFASTSAPYQEKQSASLLAAALDLPRTALTVDLAASLRSGLSGLGLALDAVAAGSAARVLVAAADQRQGHPCSEQEQMFGDGAAALLVGSHDLLAEYVGGARINDDLMDVWRNPGQGPVSTWEGRFILSQGYSACMKEAINGLLDKLSLSPEQIDLVALAAPDPRTGQGLLKGLGLEGKAAQSFTLLEQAGFCGAAQPLMLLAAALEQANAGQLILVAGYGDGAQAMLFKRTERAFPALAEGGLAEQLASRHELTSYVRFLSFKGVLAAAPGEPFRIVPSASVTWRERVSLLRGKGSRCTQCGQAVFPMQRVCPSCRSLDQFETVRLPDLAGKVFTFTKDNLAGRTDDPVVVQTVVEMANGARFYGLMTDCDPDAVELDMPVALTLRCLHDLGGFRNYFWKCRPIR